MKSFVPTEDTFENKSSLQTSSTNHQSNNGSLNSINRAEDICNNNSTQNRTDKSINVSLRNIRLHDNSSSSHDDSAETSSGDSISSKDTQEDDINDILDLYDNVEFYRGNSHKNLEYLNSSIDGSKSENSFEQSNSVGVSCHKDTDSRTKQTGSNSNSITENKLVVGSNCKELNVDQKYSKAVQKPLSVKSKTKSVPSRTQNRQGNSSLQTRKNTQPAYYMDHLENYKSQKFQCNSQVPGKQSIQTTEKVLDDLQFQKSEHSCGSSGKGSRQAVSLRSGSSQNDGSQSAYQRGDNCKLDNGVIGGIAASVMEQGVISEEESVKLSQIGIVSHSQNLQGHSLNLDEFLEEINESIDELIKTDKFDDIRLSESRNKSYLRGKASDRLVNISSSDKSGSGGNVDAMDNRGDKSIAKCEKDEILQNKSANDGLDTKDNKFNVLQEAEMGEDVVETDAGYYWLTCSIEEEKEQSDMCENNNTIKRTESLKTSPLSHTLRDTSPIPNVITSEEMLNFKSNEETLTMSETESCENNNKSEKENDESSTFDSSKPFLDDDSYDEVDSANIVNEVLRDSIVVKPDIILDLESNKAKLSVPRSDSLRNSDDISKYTDSQYLRVSDKDTRKYSCPESVFRVFKVVSVDIPPIQDPTKGEALESKSKSCSTLSNESLKSKKQHRNSLEQKKDKILEYLAELNGIGMQKGALNPLGQVIEEPINISDRARKCNETCKQNEKSPKKVKSAKGWKGNGVKKVNKCEGNKRKISKQSAVPHDLHIEPPVMFRDKTDGTTSEKSLVCIF